MEKMNGILGKVLKETERKEKEGVNGNETAIKKIIKQDGERKDLLEVAVALSEKMRPDRIMNIISEKLSEENIIENGIEVSGLEKDSIVVGINITGPNKTELEEK
jgi:hypothetical protein